MKTKRWIERILVSLTVFCLAATGLGVQPAQASPPADEVYGIEIDLALYPIQIDNDPMCTEKKYTIYGYFAIFDLIGEKSDVFGAVEVMISTELGSSELYSGCWIHVINCNTPGSYFPAVSFTRFNYFEIKYKAPSKPGIEYVTVDVYDHALHRLGRFTKSYEVINCNLAFHGTADMGATANALSPGDTWNFVGTYDVAGTVEMNEGGMANGQGTASMFMDGVAAESQVGCEFTSPIQGNTTVEVKADPEAWANGSLQLQIHLESMPVSFGGIGCTSFGGKWNTGGAAVTTAAFDLDPVSLPANGGTTSLEFQLPDQPGTFKMDLIAVIEEAES